MRCFAAVSEEDLNRLTVPELKKEVISRGGSVEGCHLKADWVQRLAKVLADGVNPGSSEGTPGEEATFILTIKV